MRRVVLIFLSLALVSASQAAVLTVTNTADDGSPGSLRWCIEHAQPGDEIRFDPILDGQPIVLTNGVLIIDKDLTIAGRGPGNTILEGHNDRVLQLGSSWEPVITTTTISDVTVTEGIVGESYYYPLGGGGIVNYGGTLTLNNSTVTGNKATTQFFGTEAVGGGIGNSGTLMLINSTVSSNSAEVGGGIVNYGSIRLDNSTITGNVASRTSQQWPYQVWPSGGGIVNRGDLTVSASTITGNVVDLVQCLDSSARRCDGGGIINDGIATIVNSTVFANVAWQRSGIVNHRSVTARNSILAGCSNAGSAAIFSLGHNLDSDVSCGLDQPSDISGEDPMLGPLQDNGGPTWTRAPLEGSPVLDAGWCDSGTDQRGVPRPLDGNRDGVWICDIGAVEYIPFEFEVVGPGGDVIVLPPGSERLFEETPSTTAILKTADSTASAFPLGELPWETFDCNPSHITCSGPKPTCVEGTAMVVDGCWGPCVFAYECEPYGCESSDECPDQSACRQGVCVAAYDCTNHNKTCYEPEPGCYPFESTIYYDGCWGPCVHPCFCATADPCTCNHGRPLFSELVCRSE